MEALASDFQLVQNYCVFRLYKFKKTFKELKIIVISKLFEEMRKKFQEDHSLEISTITFVIHNYAEYEVEELCTMIHCFS